MLTSFSSDFSLNRTPESENMREKKREKRRRVSSSKDIDSSDIRIDISPISPPSTPQELVSLIKKAEIESDPRIIHIYDQALAQSCKNKTKLWHKLFSLELGFRILRLDFPETINTLLKRQSEAGLENLSLPLRTIKDDREGPLSRMINDVLTQNRLNAMIQNCLNNQSKSKELIEVQKQAEFFYERLSEQLRVDEEDHSVLLSILPKKQFLFLLIYISKQLDTDIIEYNDVIKEIFTHLIKPKTQLHEDYASDLLWLSLHYPLLFSLLAHENDLVIIRCKNGQQDDTELHASRFLLRQSAYFSEILYGMTSEEDNNSIDIRETIFDAKAIRAILKWISHPCLAKFSFDSDITLSALEDLLKYGAAFGITNWELFLEIIQLELFRRISDDNFVEIFRVSIQFNLQFLRKLCISYINSYPHGNLKIYERSDGLYTITQTEEGGDIPELYEAIKLLKVSTATIISSKKNERSGCGKRSITSLTNWSKKLWDKVSGLTVRTACFGLSLFAVGRLTVRTACFGLSIFAVESAARESWVDKRDYPLAIGLAMIYPSLSKLFRKCMDRCNIQRDPFAITLPQIVPWKMQRACLLVEEKVYACSFRCLSRRGRRTSVVIPLLQAQSLLHSLPSNLQKIDLSAAEDLEDRDLQQIVVNYPHLTEIRFGYHPHLSLSGLNRINQLPRLNSIKFLFRRGERPGAINRLELEELFQGRQLAVEIELFDTNLLYFPPTFARTLPEGASLQIKLKHAPLPSWAVLFESYSGTAQYLSWPGTYQALVNLFPTTTHFETNIQTTDADLEILVDTMGRCQSLLLQNCFYVTDEGLECLVEQLPLLNHLSIFSSRTIRIRPEFIQHERGLAKKKPLEKIAFYDCSSINNDSLYQLSLLPQLTCCHFKELPAITDTGIQHLLPSMQELVIENCLGISDHMIHTTFPLTISHINKQVDQMQHSPSPPLPFPVALGGDLLPMVCFGNLPTLVLAEKRFGSKLANALGIDTQNQVAEELSLSTLMVFAQFRLDFFSSIQNDLLIGMIPLQLQRGDSFLDLFTYHKRELRLYNWLRKGYKKYRKQLVTFYKTFLELRYSYAFLQEVRDHAKVLRKSLHISLQHNGKFLAKELESLLPLLFSSYDRFREKLEELFFNENPLFSFGPIEERLADFHKDNTPRWSDEQRIHAIFGLLLFNLEWLIKILLKGTQKEEQTYTIIISSSDEKEHKYVYDKKDK